MVSAPNHHRLRHTASGLEYSIAYFFLLPDRSVVVITFSCEASTRLPGIASVSLTARSVVLPVCGSRDNDGGGEAGASTAAHARCSGATRRRRWRTADEDTTSFSGTMRRDVWTGLDVSSRSTDSLGARSHVSAQFAIRHCCFASWINQFWINNESEGLVAPPFAASISTPLLLGS